MPSKTTLTKVTQAAAKKADADKLQRRADTTLRAAILRALDDGHSLRAVAGAVGISHVRVLQIRDEARAGA
jgi:hypothetical protein